jgi:hypothetical protein
MRGDVHTTRPAAGLANAEIARGEFVRIVESDPVERETRAADSKLLVPEACRKAGRRSIGDTAQLTENESKFVRSPKSRSKLLSDQLYAF